MAERKIFAGPRLRRLRHGLKLTQSAMAEALGISPSYLNLIERNQRPLTVQLLLKLSAVYRIDIGELQDEAGSGLEQLREVFGDPLLAGELPGDHELVEVMEAAPNAAGAMIKLYRAYREQAARLTDVATMADSPALAMARLPVDEAREALEARPSYGDALERAAEAFAAERLSGQLPMQALTAWLQTERGIAVRVLPHHVMPDARHRFDRHSMRLFLSERLTEAERLLELAAQAALLALRPAIMAELDGMALSSPEARRIAGAELARLGGLALLMPYGRLLADAEALRYDIGLLAARWRLSFTQVAMRLTMLQRPEQAAPPFLLIEADASGFRLRRLGGLSYPKARFGGACPKLNLFAALSQPGQVMSELVELGDGAVFLTVARGLEPQTAPFGERVGRSALMLVADAIHRGRLVYGDGLSDTSRRLPIGPACRLCERRACPARVEPPLARPLGLDDMAGGSLSLDFL